MSKLEKSLIAIQKVRDKFPDEINAFLNFSQKVKTSTNINNKNKALILVSLSVHAQCEMCIESNVTSAIEAGCSNEEIIESAIIAVSMGGGPKMMYLQFVIDSLDHLK